MADIEVNTPANLDLGNAVIRYLRLLTKIHIRRKKIGYHENNDSIFNAIYRYEKFWLPMLAENSEVAILKPPWDIYFVWCLHILTSAKYRDYCLTNYGHILEHDFLDDPVEEDNARERARKIWENQFPGERFEVNGEIDDRVHNPGSELNNVITESEQKQANFFYQVSLPHFRDTKFVANAIDRYQKLCTLKQEYPAVDLCPTLDIEVIQYAHVLNPIKYEATLKQILGKGRQSAITKDLFDHVMAYDLEEKPAFTTTRQLWNVKYKTNYSIPGIKYRGLPQEGRFSKATQIHLKQSEPEAIILLLDQIRIADLWSHDQKIVIEGRCLGKTSYTYDTFFRITGQSGHVLSTKAHPVPFNLMDNRGIELHTFGIKGTMCCKHETHVATTFFDPRKLYEEDEKMENKELTVEVPRLSYGDPTVSFLCGVQVVQNAKPHIFTLYREEFALGPVPADLKPFIKISSWTDVDMFGVQTFSSARHSVRSPGGRGADFTCQVTISRDLDLGGVLLYEYGVELTAAAHTVREDQLPVPAQVSPEYEQSLDRTSGQHAMLIRNYQGDWGLCIVKQHPDADGSVQIIFENLQSRQVSKTTFTFEEPAILEIGPMSLDLHTGTVTLTANCAEAVEYVTLAYAIGVLYVFTNGHWVPEVTSYEGVRENDVTPWNPVANRMTSKKEKSKANSTKYRVTSNRLSERLSSAMTLSAVKTRRKKKTLVCSMLLACGLQANLPVEEDLNRMSSYSEISLIPRTTLDHEIPPPRWNEETSEHSSPAPGITKHPQGPASSHQTQNGLLFPISSNDQFSFRKSEEVPPQKNRSAVQMRKTSIVLGGEDYNNPTWLSPRVEENWKPGSLHETADRVSVKKHDSAGLVSQQLADSSMMEAIAMDLAKRPHLIVERIMAGTTQEMPSNSCLTSKFISEGDEIPSEFDSKEPVFDEHKVTAEGEWLNTKPVLLIPSCIFFFFKIFDVTWTGLELSTFRS